MKMSKAAWLDKDETKPDDLDAWLVEWGFDLSMPYKVRYESDGTIWYYQDEKS